MSVSTGEIKNEGTIRVQHYTIIYIVNLDRVPHGSACRWQSIRQSFVSVRRWRDQIFRSHR